MSDALPKSLISRIVLGVALGALVYLAFVLYAGIDDVRAALADFPPLLLPAAMALSFLNYVVRFPRWERYRALLGIELARRTSFLIYLAGLALTVTPGKLGEAFKSLLVRQVAGTPIHRSAPIVLAERFTDLLGFLVLLAVGGLASRPELGWVFWATLGLCALLLALASSVRVGRLALALVARAPLVGRLAPRIEGALHSTRVLLRPRELAAPTLLATVGWGLECVAFWLVASHFVPGFLELSFCAYTFALAAVAGAVLVIFPGGLGVTEASMGALLGGEFTRRGLSPAQAAAAAASATLLIRLATLWFAVGVGLTATLLFARRHGAVPDPARPST